MLDTLFPFLGGLGLFLIGMMLLSEGLVAFAGGSLKQILLAFTGRPIKAFASGALITALAQSSTATTVTLIGFVSAGLISFTQAIGVVIGASLGNTATGWIISGLGLKVNLGFYTLPLIGLGALLKLLAPGRHKELGRALAGFGTLFLGLGMLQDGMQGLAAHFSLAHLPAGGYGAHLLIMLTGLALTAVLQSSTAAIAMTLTALDAGAVSFDQAAAIVVGASIGTTLTGVLVAIGGTIYAKRTAIAYILFNVIAGLLGLLILPLFLKAMYATGSYINVPPGALGLAAFHSLFIGLGAALCLPFTQQFARWVQRLVPDRSARPQHHLDDSLLQVPALALETTQRTLEELAQRLLNLYQHSLNMSRPSTAAADLQQIETVLDQAYEFVLRIPSAADDPAVAARISALLHTIDHMHRLRSRLQNQPATDLRDSRYQQAQTLTTELNTLAQQSLHGQAPADWLEQVQARAQALTELLSTVRSQLLAAPQGHDDASRTLRITDTHRWFERSSQHVWRSSYYLQLARQTQQ